MVKSKRIQGFLYCNLLHATAVLWSIQLAPVPACSKSIENWVLDYSWPQFFQKENHHSTEVIFIKILWFFDISFCDMIFITNLPVSSAEEEFHWTLLSVMLLIHLIENCPPHKQDLSNACSYIHPQSLSRQHHSRPWSTTLWRCWKCYKY